MKRINVYDLYESIMDIDNGRLAGYIKQPRAIQLPTNKLIMVIPFICLDGSYEYVTLDVIKGNLFIRILDRRYRRVVSKAAGTRDIDIIANTVYAIIWEEI